MHTRLVQLKAIIFDMDGVLVDSEPLWKEAMIAVFGRVGLSLTAEDCAQTTGMRMDKVVDFWFEQHPWKGLSKAEIHEAVITEVESLIREKSSAMPGVYHIIEEAKSNRIEVAVASSSPKRLIDCVLEKLNLRDVISIAKSAEDELNGKPDPAVYASALRALDTPAQHAIAIEDSMNGLRSAQAAGLFTVVVPEENYATDELIDLADLHLQSLESFSLDFIEQALKNRLASA